MFEFLESARLATIVLLFAVSVGGMMSRKVSAIVAMPCLGVGAALVAQLPYVAFFDVQAVSSSGDITVVPGIFSSVIVAGTRMMASAVSAVVFGAAFARVLRHAKIDEAIVVRAAEFGSHKPLAAGFAFFFASALIATSVGGLGAVIMVGTIALPAMISSGISPLNAAVVLLLGYNLGGIFNAANYAVFLAILNPADASEGMTQIARMSLPIGGVVAAISILFLYVRLRETILQRNWDPLRKRAERTYRDVGVAALISPLVPVLIVFGGVLANAVASSNGNAPRYTIPIEVALACGIAYALFATRTPRKWHVASASFVQGAQDTSGPIVLFLGLGILIKGFQDPQLQVLVFPSLARVAGALKSPAAFVVGFSLATPLVLYRGPLNTYGIGGALPSLLGGIGFSPLAAIWALRAVGNLQGFGDPTNSFNIWIADFVGVSPDEIMKLLLPVGFLMSFAILALAVWGLGIPIVGS